MGKSLRELGEHLVLTAPEPAPELRRTIFTADDAVRDAMEAALHGDFAALDKLERTYLNVLVRIGELKVRDQAGRLWWWWDAAHPRHWRITEHGLAPFVIEYHRRWGAACAPALEWKLLPACRKCIGLLRRVDCRICDGDWHVGETNDDRATVYTDTHGVVLQVDE